ncbi:MAG: hypothetical protein ACRC0X_01675 [Brevinema sp.]
MILEIQSFLKDFITTYTTLSREQIFLSPPPTNTAKPYISILPQKGVFTPAWHWEQPNPYKIQRKYNINQPIMLEYHYADKKILSSDLNQLLINLPKDYQQISLLPVEISYLFAEGALGTHKAILLLHADYGIYHHIHHSLISDISINQINQAETLKER